MRIKLGSPKFGWQVYPAIKQTPVTTTAPAPEHTPEMPFGQKTALLKLRKGELADAILSKLYAMSAPEPSKADWRTLIDDRLIRRQDGRLALTPPGLAAVGMIMRELAPRYDIHIFARSGGRGTGRGMISRCSCCTWSRGPEMNTPGGESRIRSAETYHRRAVEDGSWARAKQSRVDFLNEVAPPKFDFSSGVVASDHSDAVDQSVPSAAPGMEVRDA